MQCEACSGEAALSAGRSDLQSCNTRPADTHRLLKLPGKSCRCCIPCCNRHCFSLADASVSVRQAVAGKVGEEELARAKKATISSVLMNLESRAVVAEDIGRQVLTYGHRYDGLLTCLLL